MHIQLSTSFCIRHLPMHQPDVNNDINRSMMSGTSNDVKVTRPFALSNHWQKRFNMQWQTFKTVVNLACDKHTHMLCPYLVLIFTPISLGLYLDSLKWTFVAEHLHTHNMNI